MKVRLIKKDGSEELLEVENCCFRFEEGLLKYQLLGVLDWEELELNQFKVISVF